MGDSLHDELVNLSLNSYVHGKDPYKRTDRHGNHFIANDIGDTYLTDLQDNQYLINTTDPKAFWMDDFRNDEIDPSIVQLLGDEGDKFMIASNQYQNPMRQDLNIPPPVYQFGGINEIYYRKYLKYKNKYLKICGRYSQPK